MQTRTQARRGHALGEDSVARIERAQAEVSRMIDAFWTIANAPTYEKSTAFAAQKTIVGTLNALDRVHDLLLEVLREYRHNPADRKVLEQAVQMTMKSRVAAPKSAETAKEKVREVMEGTALHALQILKRVATQKDVCEKNECAVAGCFRVVNTGHFDKKVMDLAGREVAEAARLVTEKGFAELCYGDAYVTTQIHSKSTVLAFWMQNEDRMYVRAKPKKNEEALALGTIIHELGHRLDFLFLSPQANTDLRMTYARWKSRYESSTFEGGNVAVGVRFSDPKRPKAVWEIVGFSYGGRGGYDKYADVVLVEDNKLKGRVPLENLIPVLGGKRKDNPFPSAYAMTDEHEMFAELFRVYILGQATPEQAEVLERLTKNRKSVPPSHARGRTRSRR